MPETYRSAGVDIAAGEEAVERIKPLVRSTYRPQVVGDLGGFGGLFAFEASRYRQPLLVSSTDGVGTKLLVARTAGRFDTIGIDLVAMCADDVAAQGGEPLFLLDYVVMGSIDPEVVTQLVAGVADGCRQAGCSLIGGETAEHPGAMADDDVDLVGFVVGVVERDGLLGPDRVRPGDRLVGLASPGLRCNGYSLARRVLLDRAGLPLEGPAYAGAGHSLADELLRPSVVYARAVVAACRAGDVRAAAHITGGGIPGNLVRALPSHCDAVVRRATWSVPAIFGEVQRLGDVADDEMDRVFNLGLGMVLVVAPPDVDRVVEALTAAGTDAFVVGEVVPGAGTVHLVEGAGERAPG